MTYVQPRLILARVIGPAASARRRLQRRCQPQLLVPTPRFHEVVVLDAIRFRSYASEGLAQVPTMILCETRGLQLFSGYPRGHRIDPETRCETAAHGAPNKCIDTLPRTRASQEPLGHHRGMKTWEITWGLFDAQAACVFSCSASKPSPLFQRVKVMAAILRASVSRAISGFIPLPSKAA